MTRYRIIRKLLRLGRSFWPIGLFAFYVLIALSFSRLTSIMVGQIFGLALVLCAVTAWLVHDYVKETDNRVRRELDDMSDLLKPYDGMKLKEMPPEIQAEVKRRLGWVAPPPNAPKSSKRKTSAAPTKKQP